MILITIFVIIGLIAWSTYALLKAHEEAKAARRDAEAQRLRLLQAAHRIPRPFSEKASQGFHRGNDAA